MPVIKKHAKVSVASDDDGDASSRSRSPSESGSNKSSDSGNSSSAMSSDEEDRKPKIRKVSKTVLNKKRREDSSSSGPSRNKMKVVLGKTKEVKKTRQSGSECSGSDKEMDSLSSPSESSLPSIASDSESALSKGGDDDSDVSMSDREKDKEIEQSDFSGAEKSDAILSDGEESVDVNETMSDTSDVMEDGARITSKPSVNKNSKSKFSPKNKGSTGNKAHSNRSNLVKLGDDVKVEGGSSCEVCHKDSEKCRRLMRCSKCKAGYHANCFRRKFSKLIQTAADKWYCPYCEEKYQGGDESRRKPLTVKKPVGDSSLSDQVKKVVDAALRAGKKFNMLVMERTEEMMKVAMVLISKVDEGQLDGKCKESDVITGLNAIQDLMKQLQFASVQAEIDLIKDVKITTEKKTVVEDFECKSPGPSRRGNMSRLYTPEQMSLLDGWYQQGPRPDAKEIAKMHQILNSNVYADESLQPQGVSLKQIRIWFDNRRAKERSDYRKQKIDELPSGAMNEEELKLYKAELNQEAKDIIDQRVLELRSKGGPVVDSPESDSEKEAEMSKNSKLKGSMRRIRIDYVASVRKAVKVARQLGKDDAEVREIRLDAIEKAKQRLNIPTKWNKSKFTVPAKFVGKEEVNHYKSKLVSMMEEGAQPEEIHDVIELLLSLHVSNKTLASTKISRQIRLVLKKYRDSDKELYKAAKLLLDKFQKVARSTNEDFEEEEENVDGEEEDDDEDSVLKGTKPSKRATRIRFTTKQLKKLEQFYNDKGKPDGEELKVILRKLNMMRDLKTQPEGITMKQLRAWYYKRRSNQKPSINVEGGDGDGQSGGSETDFDSDDMPLASVPDKSKSSRASRCSKEDKGGGRIYSKAQLDFLEVVYSSNPKPPASEISSLQEKVNSKELADPSLNPYGLSKRQLKTWFSNRRAKETMDYVREKVNETVKDSSDVDEEKLEKLRQVARIEIRDLIDARSVVASDSKTKSSPTSNSEKHNDDSQSDDKDSLQSEDENNDQRAVKTEKKVELSPSSSSSREERETPAKKRSATDGGYKNSKFAKLFHGRSESSTNPSRQNNRPRNSSASSSD